MTGVLLDMAISLDGLVCGPDGGDGGLHDWYFAPSDASRPVVDEVVATSGALVMGRRAFDLAEQAGAWEDNPYAVPHVVVTHRPPQDPRTGSTDFVFVDGVREAVARAREAAGERWATIGGGPDVARQCLALGLVDEVQLHVVPVVLSGGLPLFDRSVPRTALTLTRVVDAPNVTHLRYRVDRPAG